MASNGPGDLKTLFQCASDSYLARQNYRFSNGFPHNKSLKLGVIIRLNMWPLLQALGSSGHKKKRARERVSLDRARPFSLSPTTSKCLLLMLRNMQNINQATELNCKLQTRKKEEDTMSPAQLLFSIACRLEWEIIKRHSKFRGCMYVVEATE